MLNKLWKFRVKLSPTIWR